MKIIIIFVIVVFIFSCENSNHNVCFDIDKFSKNQNKPTIQELSVFYDTLNNKAKFITKFPILFESKIHKTEPLLQKFLINQEYQIKHTINRFFYERQEMFLPETLEIGNIEFNIKNLFSKTINNSVFENPFIRFRNLHKIQDFLLLSGEYRYPINNYRGVFDILIDIKNYKNLKIYTFITSPYPFGATYKCIFDFDNDGFLDYLASPYIENERFYTKKKQKDPLDTIKLYSFSKQKSSFILNKNHYLIVDFSKKIENCRNLVVDIQKSKWF